MMRMIDGVSRIALVCTMACAVNATQAQAQVQADAQAQAQAPTPDTPSPPTPDASAPADSAGLEDIVVTAQRRSQRLQDVPVAVTALSGEALERSSVRSLQDLTATTPGFVATNSVNYGAAPLSIRGVGGANGGANFFNDEPVAVYVDGIYIGRLSFSTSDLLDVDSLQVLRGPQGTLYGRNSTAGAILVATGRPTDSLEGRVRAGYNSFDDWRAEGVLSGPLAGDVVSGRVAVAYSDRTGFARNTVDGSKVGGSKDFSARGSLRIEPTSTLKVDAIFERLEQRAKPATVRLANVTGGPADSPFVLRPDLKDVLDDNQFTYDDPNFYNSNTTAATLLVNWDAGFATLDYLAGWRRVNSEGAQDADGTALANAGADFVRGTNAGVFRNDQFTHELRLTSPTTGPFRWIVGAFYIHENNRVLPFTLSNYRGFAALGTQATFNARQKLDAVAAFADVTYKPTDRLTLTLGGRYSYEDKRFENTQRVVTINGGTGPTGATVPAGFVVAAPPTFRDSASFKDFSFRAVADYRFTSDVLAYGSYSQGFKSGGFNTFGLTSAFDPENIDAYEIGLKTEFADRRVRLNLAAFNYDYSNLQVRLPVPTGGVNIRNAASARVRGIEADASVAITTRLRVSGNVAYLDAKFTEGSLPAVPATARYQYGTAVPLADENITGNRLSRAPRWQTALSGEYSFPVSGIGDARLSATYRYQSNVFFLETNQTQPTFRSGNWSEVGARATLLSKENGWELGLFIDNIFNNRHLTQVTALNSFPVGAVNEPRKIGVDFKFNFK